MRHWSGEILKMLELISKDDKVRRFAYTVVFSAVACWVVYTLPAVLTAWASLLK
jgi:hypothetical protein